MKTTTQHLIAEVPRRQFQGRLTIGIDLGDVWSHYCTLNEDGEVVDRGRFRTTPKAIERWFTDLPSACVAMEAGTHSIWISEQLQELGHRVIVANVRELRAISHSDRKSDQADAEKLARYARLDPNILRPISHRTVEQLETLTLIRARDLMVRLRTAERSERAARILINIVNQGAHIRTLLGGWNEQAGLKNRRFQEFIESGGRYLLVFPYSDRHKRR